MSPARTLGALRPMEAYRALSRFEGRRGHAAMRLAMHAAVPQSFRADLLHLLKLNFVPEAADDPAVEADVLLAPFSDDLGGGYFQFDPEVRRLLLDELGDTYTDEPVLRVRRVADFLLAWVDRAERRAPSSHDRLGRDFLDTQRWVALAFARPEAAAEQLAEALQKAEQAATVEARLHLGGLARAVAIPLAHHRNLLDYALALHALETGDRESAVDLLEPLPPAFEVGPVTLTPARVQSPRRRTVPEPVQATQTREPVQAVQTEQAADTAEAAPSSNVEEPQTPPLRVFISSTVMDLGEYRQAAADACLRLGLLPMLLENWASDETGLLERTLKEVGRADLFLCIVGRRYGYIPPGQYRSLMEIEYDHAVSKGVPVFCFVVDNERMRPDGDQRRLEAFKRRLLSVHPAGTASDVEEFTAKVYSALLNWEYRLKPEGVSRQRARDDEPAPDRPPKTLYLCYGPSQRVFAERLNRALRTAGLEVWMDLIELDVSRRDERNVALQQVVADADAMVFVLDDDTLARGRIAIEARIALANAPMFGLLRTGVGPDDLPFDLAVRRSVDFRDDGSFQAGVAELLLLLGVSRVDEPELGQMYGVPPLPAVYVAREEESARLQAMMIAGESRITVLTGPAGIGKTVMATACAHDQAVRRRFPDGIVWASADSDADVEQVVAVLARTLGNDVPAASTLYGQTCLLILDDMENADTVGHLASLVGVRGHVLVTSRNPELASRLGAGMVFLSGLTTLQALQLLAGRLGVPALPSEAESVAEAVWLQPDRLIQVAERVRAGVAWGDLLHRLRSEGPDALKALTGERPESPDEMPHGAVYISYASEDWAAATRLADALEQVTDVWLDRGVRSPGDDWDLDIRRNINRCSLFVVVLSRKAATRAEGYFRREWSLAVGRRDQMAAELPFIIPVIIDDLPIGAEGIPQAFWEAHAAVLPGGEVTQGFLTGFVLQLRRARRPFRPGALRDDEPVPGRLYGVPPVPATFVARERELARLKDIVLAGESRVTVLAGRGDVGKTVLAAALARDEAVRQHFPDGIMWASVSPDDGVEQVLATLLRALGNNVPDMSALYGQACLLVLDDVEDAGTVKHLATTLVGVRGHVLVTTRRSDLAFRLRARMYELGDSPFSKAVRLLAEYLDVPVERLPAEAREVADAVGPDLDGLIRVAQQVRAGADWRDLLQRLRASGTLELFDDREMVGGMPDGAVLISYSSHDRHAAERLRVELGQVMDVWMDEHDLMAGDDYARRMLQNVNRCSLFVPVLSRNAASQPEGYFRREWNLAVQRSKRISPDRPFIIPVIIDDLPVAAEGVPREFWEVQAVLLPQGEATDEFLVLVRSRLRTVRAGS